MLRTQFGDEARDYSDQNPTRVGGGTQEGDGLCWQDQERTRERAGRNEMSVSERL